MCTCIEKKKFNSWSKAESAAIIINRENKEDGDKTRLRPYKCHECGKHHLTSKTKKQFRKMVAEWKKEKRESASFNRRLRKLKSARRINWELRIAA